MYPVKDIAFQLLLIIRHHSNTNSRIGSSEWKVGHMMVQNPEPVENFSFSNSTMNAICFILPLYIDDTIEEYYEFLHKSFRAMKNAHIQVAMREVNAKVRKGK